MKKMEIKYIKIWNALTNIDEKNNNLPIEHKEKFFTKFVNFIKKLLSFHENGMLD